MAPRRGTADPTDDRSDRRVSEVNVRTARSRLVGARASRRGHGHEVVGTRSHGRNRHCEAAVRVAGAAAIYGVRRDRGRDDHAFLLARWSDRYIGNSGDNSWTWARASLLDEVDRRSGDESISVDLHGNWLAATQGCDWRRCDGDRVDGGHDWGPLPALLRHALAAIAVRRRRAGHWVIRWDDGRADRQVIECHHGLQCRCGRALGRGRRIRAR